MKALFDKVSFATSQMTTEAYSTSFSMGTRLLAPEIRQAIYGIYGFVRFADEIVDTFHEYDKAYLLTKFRADTFEAIYQKISLNPILNSFQSVVNEYQIPSELIKTFLDSMEMDLNKKDYSQHGYETYILGSAEVVGLMCLKVFVQGDKKLYEQLKPSAMHLGAAFQKINFLRDLKEDFEGMGRAYFPNIDLLNFTNQDKRNIEEEIEADFRHGLEGIKQLPTSSRFGVYMAYQYFHNLLEKIKRTDAKLVKSSRIRIPNQQKYALAIGGFVRHSLNLI